MDYYMHICPFIETIVKVLFIQQLKSLKKSSYCSVIRQPAHPALFSSGNAVWSSQMILWCYSALHPHPLMHNYCPSDSLSILGNLDTEPSGFSAVLSSQKWPFCPPRAAMEYFMNEGRVGGWGCCTIDTEKKQNKMQATRGRKQRHAILYVSMRVTEENFRAYHQKSHPWPYLQVKRKVGSLVLKVRHLAIKNWYLILEETILTAIPPILRLETWGTTSKPAVWQRSNWLT